MRATRPFLAFLLLALTAGCGPGGHGGMHHGAHALFGMHHGAIPLMHHAMRLGMRGIRGSHNFRRACADDLAKFCPKDQSRRDERQCLEGKRETLSADCKSALDAPRNGHGEATQSR